MRPGTFLALYLLAGVVGIVFIGVEAYVKLHYIIKFW